MMKSLKCLVKIGACYVLASACGVGCVHTSGMVLLDIIPSSVLSPQESAVCESFKMLKGQDRSAVSDKLETVLERLKNGEGVDGIRVRFSEKAIIDLLGEPTFIRVKDDTLIYMIEDRRTSGATLCIYFSCGVFRGTGPGSVVQ